MIVYSWQSFVDSNEMRRWYEDIHAFHSLEDAILIGLENHETCTEHTYHRVVANTLGDDNSTVVSRMPVYTVIQKKVEIDANKSLL